MAKRKIAPGQLAFGFDPPAVPSGAGSLAGDDARVAEMVSEILHADPRSRHVIAGEMSELLGEDVSKTMLDNYASRAAGHTISYSRMKALIAVTSRHDLLDADLRSIGAALLIGEEIKLARAGHIRAQLSALQAELRDLDKTTAPFSRGNR